MQKRNSAGLLWRFLCLAAFAIGSAAPVAVADTIQPRSLFSVEGLDDGVSGTGFAIARKGWVLTNASVVGNASLVMVSNRALGVLNAKVVAVDEKSDLALLRVSADPAPMPFALKAPRQGDVVSSATAAGRGAPAMSRGALSAPVSTYGKTLTHNALFGSSGYGGPLVNECGEVVGVNRTNPSLSGRLDAPSGYSVADTIDTVKEFASKFDIRIRRAAKPCVSLAVRAVIRAKAADARAQAAETKAAASQQASVAARNAAATAQDDAAKADAAQRKAQAQARQKEKIADRVKRLSLWGAIAASALVLLIVAMSLFFILRNRKQRRLAEAAASDAAMAIARVTTPPAGAHDLLLEGRTVDGERIAIKIPALALGEAHGGAVVGRNPGDAEFIVNREKISRRHCRLFVRDARIMIEDLGSTNGTLLNGHAVREASVVGDGDILSVGDIPLTVRFRN